jgi:hydrogenase expression/formation protein HypD
VISEISKVVIAGFEPLDVMQAILMLVRQVNDGRAEIENEFTRAVSREGNARAQAVTADVKCAIRSSGAD